MEWDITQVPDSLATTQFASASTTVFQSADGYGAGALQGVECGRGRDLSPVPTRTARSSSLQMALAKFQSVTNLKKEGGNLYSQTRQSGDGNNRLPVPTASGLSLPTPWSSPTWTWPPNS